MNGGDAMIAVTQSTEPIEQVVKVYKSGLTKLWLRKDIETTTDENDNTIYTAREAILVLNGDYDIEDMDDGTFEELWNEATKVEIDVDMIAEVLPTLMKTSKLSDADAVKFKALYPTWTIGETYYLDEIIRFGEDLYRIGQPQITASETYLPGSEGTTAIYSKIVIDESGYETWQPWDGVSGSYKQDQIVRDSEDGNLYKSRVPNNVWGPPHEQPTYWELYVE